MLSTIRDFFDKHIGAASGAQADDSHAIAVATAALLVEVVRMDGAMDAAERETVLNAVHQKFGLTGEEAATLIQLAEDEARQAVDYFQFTSLLNRHLSAEQKVRVIEQMWRVAYADSQVSAWEQHLIRKIGDLLYVPHGDFVAAKTRARE
ncbi:MAG: TerB family tellurite resistance protein [Burkholderiales bacterium]|nr:TerB family tellurite resistance protein [Burkholderiales bacterium]